MPANALILCLGSFVLTVVLVLLFKSIAFKFKILKSGDIPLIGGVALAIAFVFVAFFGISFPLTKEIVGGLLAAFFMLIFGVFDDWREMSVLGKLAVQLISTSILIFFGVRTQIIYIGIPLNIIITFIWVLTITNAFNHLDVMDGVAGSSAFVASVAFSLLAYWNRDFQVLLLVLILNGALLGFLLFNFPPARVYLGNSGSHFLGFILAAIALIISYAPMERKIALLSPILLLGFPVFDTGFLILMRIAKKRPPFKKSNDHLVLRFLKLGYSKERALSTMLYLNLFFAFCGLMISKASNLWGSVLVGVVILTSLALTIKMQKIPIHD